MEDGKERSLWRDDKMPWREGMATAGLSVGANPGRAWTIGGTQQARGDRGLKRSKEGRTRAVSSFKGKASE